MQFAPTGAPLTRTGKDPAQRVFGQLSVTTGGAGEFTGHASIGFSCPQLTHRVRSNCAPHFGHLACVRNVSNAVPHRLHFHSAPRGGAARQAGQAKPSWRGALSSLVRTRAARRPRQQFMRMNMAITPI